MTGCAPRARNRETITFLVHEVKDLVKLRAENYDHVKALKTILM